MTEPHASFTASRRRKEPIKTRKKRKKMGFIWFLQVFVVFLKAPRSGI